MLAQRLKELRIRKKKTQQDIAKYLGLTRPAYTAYESGTRNPDYDTLIKIADYFDVSLDYLLGREERNKGSELQSIFPFDQVGISQHDFENLSTYQQEVLEWAVNVDGLFFKDKADNVLDMMERLEIAYEVDKVMKKRKKKE